MKRNVYAVILDEAGTPTEYQVVAMLGDQMRAEVELKKRRQDPTEHGVAFVSAIAWAALAREGKITDPLDAFAARCYDVSRVDPADLEAGVDELDPTRPVRSIGSV